MKIFLVKLYAANIANIKMQTNISDLIQVYNSVRSLDLVRNDNNNNKIGLNLNFRKSFIKINIEITYPKILPINLITLRVKKKHKFNITIE